MNKLFGEKLHLDWKIAVLVVFSTLALILDSYHAELAPWATWFPAWNRTGLSTKIIDRTLLYFILPTLITLLVFRQRGAEYGFSLGDWKAGIILTLVSILLIAPVLWFVSRQDSVMQNYYEPMLEGSALEYFAGPVWMGIFFQRLAVVRSRPQIWPRSDLAAGGPVCAGAYRQTGD